MLAARPLDSGKVMSTPRAPCAPAFPVTPRGCASPAPASLASPGLSCPSPVVPTARGASIRTIVPASPRASSSTPARVRRPPSAPSSMQIVRVAPPTVAPRVEIHQGPSEPPLELPSGPIAQRLNQCQQAKVLGGGIASLALRPNSARGLEPRRIEARPPQRMLSAVPPSEAPVVRRYSPQRMYSAGAAVSRQSSSPAGTLAWPAPRAADKVNDESSATPVTPHDVSSSVRTLQGRSTTDLAVEIEVAEKVSTVEDLVKQCSTTEAKFAFSTWERERGELRAALDSVLDSSHALTGLQ